MSRLLSQDRVRMAVVTKNSIRASLFPADSVATALNKMSMGRYRHIPVRKADGTYSVTSIKHVIKYIAKAEW